MEVLNWGVDPILKVRAPQGCNPDKLMRSLHLKQQPGCWMSMMTAKQARSEIEDILAKKLRISYTLPNEGINVKINLQEAE